MTEKKQIHDVCIDCGRKYGNKPHKEGHAIGVWNGTCDICGKENVSCASAQHDYGIYNNDEERKSDKMQDRI